MRIGIGIMLLKEGQTQEKGKELGGRPGFQLPSNPHLTVYTSCPPRAPALDSRLPRSLPVRVF